MFWGEPYTIPRIVAQIYKTLVYKTIQGESHREWLRDRLWTLSWMLNTITNLYDRSYIFILVIDEENEL